MVLPSVGRLGPARPVTADTWPRSAMGSSRELAPAGTVAGSGPTSNVASRRRPAGPTASSTSRLARSRQPPAPPNAPAPRQGYVPLGVPPLPARRHRAAVRGQGARRSPTTRVETCSTPGPSTPHAVPMAHSASINVTARPESMTRLPCTSHSTSPPRLDSCLAFSVVVPSRAAQ